MAWTMPDTIPLLPTRCRMATGREREGLVRAPIDGTPYALQPAMDTQPNVDEVLLVEDDEALRQALELALRDLGWRVRCVADGEEAVRQMGLARPAVVVTDLRLPGLDGVEVVERLRTEHAAVPVVVASGHLGEGERRRLERMGVAEILAKPFSPDALDRSLRQALGLPVRDLEVVEPEPGPGTGEAGNALAALAINPGDERALQACLASLPRFVPPSDPRRTPDLVRLLLAANRVYAHLQAGLVPIDRAGRESLTGAILRLCSLLDARLRPGGGSNRLPRSA